MDQKIYHGDLTPSEIAHGLLAFFHRGNYRVQQVGNDEAVTVQIATVNNPISGGQTAMTVRLQKVADGVSVMIGQQAWLVWLQPGNNCYRCLAESVFPSRPFWTTLTQDIESLQLKEKVLQVIDNLARARGADFELSERLRRLVCDYCLTANPLGEPSCIACGAPLGEQQPYTCTHCGFVMKKVNPSARIAGKTPAFPNNQSRRSLDTRRSPESSNQSNKVIIIETG